jgi:hypothetical protein
VDVINAFVAGVMEVASVGVVLKLNSCDRNLGATRVAASSTDTEARGYYYQWGRNDDGHEFSLSTTPTLATSITPATNAFITSTSTSTGADWTTIDRDGSLRTAAWADGGVNDICLIIVIADVCIISFRITSRPSPHVDSIRKQYPAICVTETATSCDFKETIKCSSSLKPITRISINSIFL